MIPPSAFVLPLNMRASPVALAEEMTMAAWTAYVRRVREASLYAHLESLYCARIARTFGGCALALRLLVGFGSAGAVATWLTSHPSWAIALSVIVALATALQQGVDFSSRAARAALLADAWTKRTVFWDDALAQVMEGRYLGSLAPFDEADAEIASGSSTLPRIDRWRRQLMDRVEATDPYRISA